MKATRASRARMATWTLALLVARPAAAEQVLVPGRGPVRSDCLVGWTVELASPPSARSVRKARIRCEDGSPGCDADGTVDGRCTFRVRSCFGNDGAPPCTPEAMGLYTLRRPSRRAARRDATAAHNRSSILDAVARLDPPILPGTCTADASIEVPIKRSGRAGKAILRSRVRKANGRGSDDDVLRLTCKPAAASEAAQRLGFVLTSDFQNTGAYSTIGLDTPRSVRRDLGRTHSDAVARAFRGRVYVVNRLGQDNVQVVNPNTGNTLTACSVGNGSNPQDIAFVSDDKAYVSRFRDGILSIVDPTVPETCAGFRKGRIDLGRFADADGTPELGRMLLVNDELYVAVLRLDRDRKFLPASRGLIAVIDTETDTLVDVDPETPQIDAISLTGENPFGMVFDESSGRIWIWEPGDFFDASDGGIDAIDPATKTKEGFIASEADLGGSVTALAPYSRERAFAVVADDSFRNRLVAFSPQSGELLDILYEADSFLPDVAVNDRGEVWLADRTLREPGVRIFDAESGEALAGPINVGLKPFSILFLP